MAELYCGNKYECIYAGYMGNVFGAQHDKVVEEGVYFVKIRDNEYVELDELLSNKKKKQVIKDFATNKGEIFVGDLVLVNDVIESRLQTKKK